MLSRIRREPDHIGTLSVMGSHIMILSKEMTQLDLFFLIAFNTVRRRDFRGLGAGIPDRRLWQ